MDYTPQELEQVAQTVWKVAGNEAIEGGMTLEEVRALLLDLARPDDHEREDRSRDIEALIERSQRAVARAREILSRSRS
ncbi:hypothetical protein [Rhodococcus rhodochrous]|uniref:hypothetical protein n=1 Tax=Rhodococcus rhodochrous TaxID=1829 RepID=UPI00177C2203|nr:hypothetical protein [Rhodococcus rhodochrous]QOH56262.1 hypothetical protein C6Y44_10005 [Rhodococcus rhodochrous]